MKTQTKQEDSYIVQTCSYMEAHRHCLQQSQVSETGVFGQPALFNR